MKERPLITVTALVDLIRFFEAGGSTDAPTVAERYGVAERTAQRWFDMVERWTPLERKRTGKRVTVRRLVLR